MSALWVAHMLLIVLTYRLADMEYLIRHNTILPNYIIQTLLYRHGPLVLMALCFSRHNFNCHFLLLENTIYKGVAKDEPYLQKK